MYKDDVLAMILAGGEGRRLNILSEKRAKPAVPFGGKYRIIDFSLSNCVNSGIFYVGILTQYNPRSLHEHIRIGKDWDLDRIDGGVFILQPYISDVDTEWYRGTADAIYQNLRFIRDRGPKYVLILSGDHIYTMDYRLMLDFHQEKNADLTVAVIEVPIDEAHRFGIFTLNQEREVIGFQEKPLHPRSNLASMGIYVFRRQVLEEEVENEAMREGTSHDFGKDIIPRMIRERRVFTYPFRGYWKDVGTIDSYWEANMELLNDNSQLQLRDASWPIYSQVGDRPPVKFGRDAEVEKCIIGEGAIVNGRVLNSVIFSGVYISEEVNVMDSIIMNDTLIKRGAKLERVILDKSVVIGEDCRIGSGTQFPPNTKYPDMLQSGLTVVGKNTHIPSGVSIGRNCIISSDLNESDFPAQNISSGETVEKPQMEG
ncbi:MAG: glucose-1-phosphate adenylyltransferase [Candidatus Atribacteria bacterium]|nr:glucose-1-phosphate adenylyltransferase [Candidatus Atribacteria bacterium]